METLPKNAILYTPEEGIEPVAVIQIIHGMAEHQLRYVELAKFLNSNGIVVITSDLRGHGNNVRRPEDLGYFGDNAVMHLVADVHDITQYAKTHYKRLPYFILGHSMGTLVATCYFRQYDNFVDGLFLSGMPAYNSAAGIAKIIIKAISMFKGEFHRSALVNGLCNGPFSKAFPNEGSEFAWLANDPEVWKRYENDEKCGYVFTLNGFDTLMNLLTEAYSDETWILKNKKCPIMLMSGSDDPCRVNDEMFQKSVSLFKSAGYQNVKYLLYGGQRHEIFNDTEKENAMIDLLVEIKEIIKFRNFL